MALPNHVERVQVLSDPASASGPLMAMAKPVGESAFDCLVVDSTGNVVMRMDGYQSIAFPAPIPDDVTAVLRDTFTP